MIVLPDNLAAYTVSLLWTWNHQLILQEILWPLIEERKVLYRLILLMMLKWWDLSGCDDWEFRGTLGVIIMLSFIDFRELGNLLSLGWWWLPKVLLSFEAWITTRVVSMSLVWGFVILGYPLFLTKNIIRNSIPLFLFLMQLDLFFQSRYFFE